MRAALSRAFVAGGLFSLAFPGVSVATHDNTWWVLAAACLAGAVTAVIDPRSKP